MREEMRNLGMPSVDRTDTVAQAFSRRGSAAPLNLESHTGEQHHLGFDDQGLVIADAAWWNTARA